MANKLTLQHKRNSISGTAPNAADIAVGEIAVNLADKKLFTKDNTNAIVELGGGASVTVSATAPASPNIGDGWVDTLNNSQLFVWDSSSWLAPTAYTAANAVGASELNVVGNGTAGQALTSDGDGTFSWVDAGSSSTTAGDVGTYVFARGELSTTGRQFVWNTTYAGSGLYPAGPSAYQGVTGSGSTWNSAGYGMAVGDSGALALSGTWRCLGHTHQTYDNPVTLFVRIS